MQTCACGGGSSCLIVMVGPEEDGDKGEPHDAGGVHCEPDILRLVEVFRNLSVKDTRNNRFCWNEYLRVS